MGGSFSFVGDLPGGSAELAELTRRMELWLPGVEVLLPVVAVEDAGTEVLLRLLLVVVAVVVGGGLPS